MRSLDTVPSGVRASRRQFLAGLGASVGAATGLAACSTTGPGARAVGASAEALAAAGHGGGEDQLVVSTWKFGMAANAAAMAAFDAGVSHPFEACEAGVRVPEADPEISSVGYGGLPNAHGVVQLDSCLMRGDTLGCGGVAALEGILHPVSVARRVMERTRHVLLVGEGARQFALSQGFPSQDLTTERSREAYQRWRANQPAEIVEPWEAARRDPNEDHDTIGMIALDAGRLAMAVTTSGMGWKLPGRVGDSPIIGAGGYADDAAGAVVSTGVGEEVIRSCGSFAIVEGMRRGATPLEACAEVLTRIRDTVTRLRPTDWADDVQVGFIAVTPEGEVAALALRKGFTYALSRHGETELIDVEPLA